MLRTFFYLQNVHGCSITISYVSAMFSSFIENRGSVTKTTTTRRVVQNQSYTSANGDEYAIPDVPGILQNPTFQSVQNGPKMDDSQGKQYDKSLFPIQSFLQR